MGRRISAPSSDSSLTSSSWGSIRSSARHQRHGAEPSRKRRHGRNRRRCLTDLWPRDDRGRCHGRRVHQQRYRYQHGDHAVRHRLPAGSGGDESPANAGTLIPTGKLTVDTKADVEFDIYSTIRNGTTVDVQGLAALTVGGQAQFYKITLFSGKSTFRGAFAAQDQVIGIAIPLNQL